MTFTFELSAPTDISDWVGQALAINAVLISVWALWFTLRSANRTLLQSQMEAYINAYVAAAASRDGIPHSVEEYKKATDQRKLIAKLLVARLIGIVDLMNRTDDRRLPAWAHYMTGIRGPLGDPGAGIEHYAGHGATLSLVSKAQLFIRSELDLTVQTSPFVAGQRFKRPSPTWFAPAGVTLAAVAYLGIALCRNMVTQ